MACQAGSGGSEPYGADAAGDGRRTDLNAIAERPGASAEFGAQLLELQQQLFEQWHRYKGGTIDWLALQQECRPIRLAFEATLQRVVELGAQRGE